MYVAGQGTGVGFRKGVALATSLSPYYGLYVKGTGANAGLEPKMISADIAVALVRAGNGLATLTKLSDGTPVSLGTGSKADIITAYSGADTVITGAVFLWVANLVAGFSTMDRLRARGLEALLNVVRLLGVPAADASGWNVTTGAFSFQWTDTTGAIDGLKAHKTGPTWKKKSIPAGVVQGWGANEAARGALMHQCEITNGKITKYQCIVPTTWNGSPADANNNHGPMEASVIGAPFAGLSGNTGVDGGVASVGGVEVLRIAQSFDPCIACAIH
jgi:Ni,Fe-hydrogenase I large subunit